MKTHNYQSNHGSKFIGSLVGALVAVVFTLASISSPATAAQTDMPLNLTYRVQLGVKSLGTIEVQLKRNEELHTIRSVTRPEGIVRLFGGDVVESFDYTPTGKSWLANSYEEQSERKDKDFTVQFENGAQLTAKLNETMEKFPANSIVEPQAFPLAAYYFTDEILDKQKVLIPSRHGIRTYQYDLVGEETLTIDKQSYNATKWTRRRIDKDDRWVEIWIDTKSRIPLRIDTVRGDRTVTAELIENGS
ncbi:MAG: hypothetical protein DHS20C01_25060 [marine bacterium B5-7]|nr:MAG: hypothetical protein DHS20C01_25060 [marine bacterium B5-7]